MSQNNQHMEEFLRRKLAEKEFPYQAAYWQSAQTQMAAWDAGRKRKSRLLVLFLLLAGSIAMVSLGLWHGERRGIPVGKADSEGFSREDSAMEKKEHQVFNPRNKDLAELSSVAGFPYDKRRQKVSGHSAASATTGKHGVMGASSLVQQQVQEARYGQALSMGALSRISLSGEASNLMPDSFPGALADLRDLSTPAVAGKAHRTWSLVLQVGVAGYREFSREQQSSRILISPQVGMQARVPFGHRWEGAFGLQYFFRKGINRQHGTRTLVYDFQATESRTAFEARELHFLALPLELGYRAGRRHRFFAGPTLLYLLNVKGDLQESQTNTLGDSKFQQEQAWGYANGFSGWDLDLHLGYAYRISPRWEAAISGHLGLLDLTDNTVFASSSRDRNHRLVFSIGYNLK